jgi:anthranilate synthase component I
MNWKILPENSMAVPLVFLGFNGDFNHAILIRSFVSENNQFRFQAGAGVVAKSSIPSELQEVTNKLEALRVALENSRENLINPKK